MRPVRHGLRGDERGEDGRRGVAVDALRVPAEGVPFLVQRLETHHLGGRAVGLLIITVDEREKIAQPMVCAGHRGLPRRAFLALTVGQQVEYARGFSV